MENQSETVNNESETFNDVQHGDEAVSDCVKDSRKPFTIFGIVDSEFMKKAVDNYNVNYVVLYRVCPLELLYICYPPRSEGI